MGGGGEGEGGGDSRLKQRKERSFATQPPDEKTWDNRKKGSNKKGFLIYFVYFTKHYQFCIGSHVEI